MVFTIHSLQLRRTILAGITYFAVVFGISLILGTIRVLLIVPRLGERAAELIENPVMLIFIVLTARWVVSRFELARPVLHKLVAGLFALTLMLFMEFEVVLRLRELSLTQ